MHEHGYPLNEFAEGIRGDIIQKGNHAHVQKVGIDSRKIQGDLTGFAFIAIRGAHKNAHQYLQQVYDQGVRTFVVCEDVEKDRFPDATIIRVKDGIEALQAFAAFHRSHFDIPVMAITGSNAKTIIKEWAYQLLFKDGHILRSPNSYNSQVGVPLSVLLLNQTHEFAIFEAGISMPGEMERLEAIIQPEIGIFTNIGPAHQENFETIDQKISEKLALFKNCKTLIYCKNQQAVATQIESKIEAPARLSWAMNENADLQVSIESQRNGETNLQGIYKGESHGMTLPFTQSAFIENACHLWLLMLHLGKSEAVISERMKALATIPMRMEQLVGINGCVIINDVYNSDFHALEIALDQLKSQRKNQKFTAIISDIIEAGQDDDALNKSIAGLLRNKHIDRLIGIGPKLCAYQSAFDQKETHFFNSTKEFISSFSDIAFEHENILIKGAREFRFEKIVDLLQEQSHETVLEIDLGKMVDNLNFVRSTLAPETKVMVMVKAFAYGSGSYDVARFLEYNGVDYLAVAYADEGISLRADGITLPILVLNPEIPSYAAMIRHNLEPQIYNFRTLRRFTEALKESDKSNGKYPIHIKINTGMNRLGFDLSEIQTLAEELKDNGHVKVVSAFSHLSGSDENWMDDFTNQQAASFVSATNTLEEALGTSFLKHLLNSNGILRHSEYQFDMVRVGIALYGISTHPDTRAGLQPVSSLHTSISQIREIPAGERVGYSPKSQLDTDKTIAVLPIGYADGLPRLLGNGVGKVWINGALCPVVGNMCMDMCMVDVTHIICQEGDSVEIFGENISIYQMAEWLQTIPYEVLTNISQRVKRVSVQS